MKVELVALGWSALSLQAVAASASIARPDLVGAAHFAAFALGTGGLMAILYHKDGEPYAVRKLAVGTLLAGVSGTVTGAGYSEWTGQGNIAVLMAAAAAAMTAWGVSGRDVFTLIERILTLWKSKD